MNVVRADHIELALQQLADTDRASSSQRFFKTGRGQYGEGDCFLGIKVPQLRSMVRRFESIELSEVEQLINSPYHEIRLFSLFLLVRKFDRGNESERKANFDFYLANTQGVNNWDLVDSSAYQIVGRFLEHRDHDVLFSLADSSDLWRRRISMIACYWFIKQKQYATALLLAEKLLSDTEDLIHKAVGWMLREIGNRDIDVEKQFLAKHYHAMPRTMLRYAIEKFPAELRAAYLSGNA